VVVLDYGSGNLHSATRALAETGAEVVLTADARAAQTADGLVVPGVGAFAACMAGVRSVGGDEIIAERVRSGRPILGICVGHQILFTSGAEHGVVTRGCAVYPGTVTQVPARRLPHMGWNQVRPAPDTTLFRGVESERFYFVHSYAALRAEDAPSDALITWTTHADVDLVAAVEWGPVCSTQFHPEKSGAAGARLLGTWISGLGKP
jgi:glutamine amidotransferase